MEKLRELALFAGVGGGILGTRGISRVVCAVEIDPYRREILLRRQEEGFLPPFPVWDDARTFDGGCWRGAVDLVTAGFPCQFFSTANKGTKREDRNLWPETARIIGEVEPSIVLLENVVGIKRYLPVVLDDLRGMGYCVPPRAVVAAASVGAGHIRRRVWIPAYSYCERQPALSFDDEMAVIKKASVSADTNGKQLREQSGRGSGKGRSEEAELGRAHGWSLEPGVPGVAHGVPHRMDRLAAVGDAQVPGVVRRVWELMHGDRSQHTL